MGHTEALVMNKVDVLIIMKGGILMVTQKLIEFVKKYGFWILLSLEQTLEFSVSFSCNSEYKFNIKTLLFVYAGCQVIKQIVKVITKKQNTK